MDASNTKKSRAERKLSRMFFCLCGYRSYEKQNFTEYPCVALCAADRFNIRLMFDFILFYNGAKLCIFFYIFYHYYRQFSVYFVVHGIATIFLLSCMNKHGKLYCRIQTFASSS